MEAYDWKLVLVRGASPRRGGLKTSRIIAGRIKPAVAYSWGITSSMNARALRMFLKASDLMKILPRSEARLVVSQCH